MASALRCPGKRILPNRKAGQPGSTPPNVRVHDFRISHKSEGRQRGVGAARGDFRRRNRSITGDAKDRSQAFDRASKQERAL